MKILITKSSSLIYEEVKEFDSLSSCIDEILSNEDLFVEHGPKVVVSRVPDWMSFDYKECDYRVEIYDTWRE